MTTPPHLSSAAPFGAASGLACRECGATYDLGPGNACELCFGPLEIAYDEVAARFGEPRVDRGRAADHVGATPALLPVAPVVDLQVGISRLHRADNLARELGMKTLWVKDESGNPTHSFKDRVVAVAASAARTLGFEVLSCASTGNLANAVAAAAARAGMRSVGLHPR